MSFYHYSFFAPPLHLNPKLIVQFNPGFFGSTRHFEQSHPDTELWQASMVRGPAITSMDISLGRTTLA